MIGALVLAPRLARAQCPDGTPLPCATPRRVVSASRTVPPPAARARRFLLLPFRNVTRVPAQDWLVTGAPLMLGETLGQFRDLTVVTEEKLTAARRRLAIRADSQPDVRQLRRLAEETDGWTAVSGNIYASGQKLRITVQALDVQTERVVTTAQAEIAADADGRQALDSLTVRLGSPTGVQGARADLAALTTKSADAYVAYVRGIGLLQRSAFRRAQQAFSEAVTLDSTFALAWSRLAFSQVNANVATMLDPSSIAARAIEQSVRLGARLPARQAEYMRATQSFMRGQWVRSRTTLDSLVATDRDDLDARELLAGLRLNDFEVDTTGGAPRMASSMNQSMLLAREVLERDPGRRNIHSIFAMGYGLAGGWWFGARLGVVGTYNSLAAMLFQMMIRGPDLEFVPVLRDSIVLVPRAEFEQLAPAERARLRRRSADVGMEWVERWLLVGPQDAEAHLWASRLAELRDDAPRALRELALADSLGVESSWENVPQRRLTLLVRAERHAAAAALTDSLLRAGELGKRPLLPGLDRGRGYGMSAFLLSKRWADAGAVVAAQGRPTGTGEACTIAYDELRIITGEAGGAALRAMTDTVARYLGTVAAIPSIAPCLEKLLLLVNDSTAGRRSFAGAALLAVADSLQRAGDLAFAIRAATWAVAMDTTRRAAVLERAWYRPSASPPGRVSRPASGSYRAGSAETAQRKPVRERSAADAFGSANPRSQGVARRSSVSNAPPRIT